MDNNIPEEIKIQINGILNLCKKQLRENLVGIYLHGSLAMGCFNRDRSDIDIIVVVKEPIYNKEDIIKELMKISLNPSPIEVSFLIEDKLKHHKSLCHYNLHYSEYWRENYSKILLENKKLENRHLEDGDLSAHIRVINERGITLYGKDKELLFPKISDEEYLKSILYDFEDAWENFSKKPEYYILNTCRILNFLETHKVTSKREAGEWALEVIPEKFRSIIKTALDVYTGKISGASFHGNTIKRFLNYANYESIRPIE